MAGLFRPLLRVSPTTPTTSSQDPFDPLKRANAPIERRSALKARAAASLITVGRAMSRRSPTWSFPRHGRLSASFSSRPSLSGILIVGKKSGPVPHHACPLCGGIRRPAFQGKIRRRRRSPCRGAGSRTRRLSRRASVATRPSSALAGPTAARPTIFARPTAPLRKAGDRVSVSAG